MIKRLASLLLLAAVAPALASPLHEAAKRLDGQWQGGEFVLRVDSERAQANLDPERPFQWQRFEVEEVTEDDEVIFSVGAEVYEATINAEMLTLSSTGFRGERVLMRQPNPVEPITAEALNLRGRLD